MWSGSMQSSSGKGGGAIYHRGQFCDRTVHFLIHDHHCFLMSSLEIYKLFFPQLLEPFHLISLLCCAERKLGCFCKLEIQLHLQTAFAGLPVHKTSCCSSHIFFISIISFIIFIFINKVIIIAVVVNPKTQYLLKPFFSYQPNQVVSNSYSSTDSYLYGT